jgi:hypothetical protein
MRAVAVVLALIGGFGVVITMGAFVLSSACWEYCEDEPTVGDALQFALPFGLVALAFLAAAANLFMPGRGSWPRALGVALGSMVLGGLLTWAAVGVYEAVDGGWLARLAWAVLAGVWLGATAGAAMRS